MTAANADTIHPYYTLLPSYITPASITQERTEFVTRIEDTRQVLQQLRHSSDVKLEKRHLRVIETFFKLKHVLPKDLHRDLIHELLWHVWEQDGQYIVDIELESRAVTTLKLLLDKWCSKRPRHERREVTIHWRLAKRAIDRVCFSQHGYIRPASQVIMQSLASSMIKCVESARPFFVGDENDDATTPLSVQLWREFGPVIKNTKSNACFQALGYFSLLLKFPEPDSATYAATWSAIEPFLPEWFDAWALIQRCSHWDGHWFKVFSRLAKRFPEQIANGLRVYLPFIFAKVHDLLDLPSDLGSPFVNHTWPSAFSILHGTKRADQHAMRLCAYLLENPNSDAEVPTASQYILELLNTMKSFFHPSNASNAANGLGITVYYLSSYISKRLGHEKATNQVLQVQSCRAIFDALLDLAYFGIYSKSRAVSHKSMYLIKSLVCLDPAHCARPVLEQMVKALDPSALSQSHMAPAAISSMSVFLYHLMSGQHPDGSGAVFSTYLAPLLRLTLPGIDPNDEKKTMSTLTLYFHVLSWLPLVNDVSKKASSEVTKARSDASRDLFRAMAPGLFAEMQELGSDIDQRMWELGSFIEEWSLSMLDRCFDFIRSRANSHRLETASRAGDQGHRSGGGDEVVLEVLNVMSLLYAQMSTSIYTQALRRTVTFVANSFFTSDFGGKVIATLIANCVQVDPQAAFPLFMELVVNKLRVTKSTVDVSSLMTNEKVWYLQILNGLTRFNDADRSVLLSRREELQVIMAHFLHHEDEKEVYEAAGVIIQNLLHALLGVYPVEFRSLPPTEWAMANSENAGMFQFLGAATTWRRLGIQWHEPSEHELTFGYQLIQDHLLATFESIDKLVTSKDVNVRTWIPHLKRVSECIRGVRNVLVDDLSTEATLLAGSYPLLVQACGENKELLARFVSLKAKIMTKVHDMTVFWREHGSKGVIENQIWQIVLKMMKQLLVWRGSHQGAHKSKEKQNLYIKATTADVASRQLRKARRFEQSSIDETPLVSRNEMNERVLFFYSKRKVQEHFELGFHVMQDSEPVATVRSLYESLLVDIEILMKNTYEEVRHEASNVLQESSEIYARWTYSRIGNTIDVLEGKVIDDSGHIKHEVVCGAVDFLSRPMLLNYLWKQRGSLLERLVKALLRNNELVINKLETESSKTTIGLKCQAVYLAVLASWRYVRGPVCSSSLLSELLAAEPTQSEHWKVQLMHLVSFYPFLQPQEMQLPLPLWKLVIKQLRHEVLPVRQVAILLFSQLVKLHKTHKTKSIEVDELLFEDATLKALMDAFVDNHRNTHRFSASADGQHANSAPSDWSFGVNEVIRYLSNTTNAYPKSPPLSSVRLMNQTSDSFKSVGVAQLKLIQRLTQMNGRAVVEGCIIPMLQELTQRIDAKQADEDRQAALSTLAEWIGGMLRGLVKADQANEEFVSQAVASIRDVLVSVLPHVTVTLVEPWSQVLYYVSRPSNGNKSLALGRLSPLVDYVLEELEQSFARATSEDYARQVKWLTLVEPFLIHFLALQNDTSPDLAGVVNKLRDHVVRVIDTHALAHQYKMVRDRVARTLHILDVSGVVVPLDVLFALSGLHPTDVNDAHEGDEAENAVALSAKETAMLWLTCAERSGNSREFSRVLKTLFPVAFLTQNHSKVEIALLAKNTTNAISLSLRLYSPPPDAEGASRLTDMLTMLEQFAGHQLWKTRAAVLRFLTSFTFYHWIFLSSILKQRVQALIMLFLNDEQREVQDMAKYALRSLIHIERADIVDQLSRELTEKAQDARVKHPKLMRRLQKQEKDESSATRDDDIAKTKERIKTNENVMAASVLGMSAIILAFPYTVPDFVPPLFVELGRYLYVKYSTPTISYLEKAVKDTLLEFKRTHQDNWIEIKSKFTTEQRDVFEDVLISPGYYT